MDSVIGKAIRNRHQLTFIHRHQLVTVEPYCYGRARDGRALLRAWQVAGGEPGWRLFDVAEMIGARATGTPFEPARAGYDARDAALDTVFVRI